MPDIFGGYSETMVTIEWVSGYRSVHGDYIVLLKCTWRLYSSLEVHGDYIVDLLPLFESQRFNM